MFENEEKDVYDELFKAAKFTNDELKKYPVCKNFTEEELTRMSDFLFDLGIIAQKIMIECNE
ncbi:MAG: hypothetical protein ABSD71_00300 [Bacteroidales bacterium]|jgi:hypothetical protein